MNQLATVLLSIAAAVGTVLVYAALRGGADPDTAPRPAGSAELRGLQDRLATLEADRQPVLEGTGLDPRILEHLRELDRRLEALESATPRAAPTPGSPPHPKAEMSEIAREELARAAKDGPLPADVELFRTLRAAARREDHRKRIGAQIDKSLESAGIRLTERQRKQLVEASLDFEPRRMEIWGEAKAQAAASGAGPDTDWRELIATTNATIRREFTERVAAFLPLPDAERIAELMDPERSK